METTNDLPSPPPKDDVLPSESLAWQHPAPVPVKPHAEASLADDTLPSESPVGPEQVPAPLPPEQGGVPGPEPTRFGDWEKNGIAWDF